MHKIIVAITILLAIVSCGNNKGENMLISKIVPSSFISTNVNDNYPDYAYLNGDESMNGQIVKRDNKLFVISGIVADWKIPIAYEYDAFMKNTYKVGDVLRFGGVLKRVIKPFSVLPSNETISSETFRTTLMSSNIEYKTTRKGYRLEAKNFQENVDYVRHIYENTTVTRYYEIDKFSSDDAYDIDVLVIYYKDENKNDSVPFMESGHETITLRGAKAHNAYTAYKESYRLNRYFLYDGNLYSIVDDENIFPAEDSDYFEPYTFNLTYFSEMPNIAPFDERNSSIAFRANNLSYTFKNLGKFDTVSISNAIGSEARLYINDTLVETIDISRSEKDLNGSELTVHSNLYRGITDIFYTDLIDINSTIRIEIDGAYSQIGSIMLGKLLEDTSYTNLEYTLGFKDFSPTEQNQWGEIFRKEGVKVLTLDGSCLVPLSKMTQNALSLVKIAGNVAIFNGSNSKEKDETEGNEYAMLKMVGRLSGFNQRSIVKRNQIKYAEYPFKIEEIV